MPLDYLLLVLMGLIFCTVILFSFVKMVYSFLVISGLGLTGLVERQKSWIIRNLILSFIFIV